MRRRIIKKVVVILIATMLFGCAHIEGTRDKSSTLQQSSTLSRIDAIALLPIKEQSGTPGLSRQIEIALQQSLEQALPSTRVVGASAAGSRLAAHELISTYGQWQAGYESTSILDPRPVAAMARATDARYLLLIQSIHLARERIRAADSGYTGVVNDANNTWRTDLKLVATLIDTKSKQVEWKGLGYAEHIHSPKKDQDLFFVIFHDKNPEVSQYVGQMITTATQGLAAQLCAAQNAGSASCPKTVAFRPVSN